MTGRDGGKPLWTKNGQEGLLYDKKKTHSCWQDNFSQLQKLDKEIDGLLNMLNKDKSLKEEQKEKLIQLFRKKTETLQPVYIYK